MSEATCPNCGQRIVLTKTSDPACVTCGRLISEHIRKFGHADWCQFLDKLADRPISAAPQLMIRPRNWFHLFVHWCPIQDSELKVYGGRRQKYVGISWRRFHAEFSLRP